MFIILERNDTIIKLHLQILVKAMSQSSSRLIKEQRKGHYSHSNLLIDTVQDDIISTEVCCIKWQYT
jgi:hypothetical protein